MYGFGYSLFSSTNSILANSSSGGGIDPDAQAFITAAAITDPTQQSAVNQLVIDLKADGVWSKMKAIYPFVGGTASTHKFNLKNPLDTDAAYRLTFNGGWTHSSNGALPNGTNAYANTFLIPNTKLTLNSTHASFYSRTNSSSGMDIGCSDGGFTNMIFMLNRFSGDNRNYLGINSSALVVDFAGFPRSDGFFCLRRNNSTEIVNSRNSVNTTFSQNSGGKSTFPIYISSMNQGGTINYISNRQAAFASIGDGLTDTEAANLNTRVQTFQTTLNRNV
jgi:hypothetical protein